MEGDHTKIVYVYEVIGVDLWAKPGLWSGLTWIGAFGIRIPSYDVKRGSIHPGARRVLCSWPCLDSGGCIRCATGGHRPGTRERSGTRVGRRRRGRLDDLPGGEY